MWVDALPWYTHMDPLLLPYVVTIGALVLGLVLGLILGWRIGLRELRAYQHGQRDAQERQLLAERNRGGPCWVRGQLPPAALEIDQGGPISLDSGPGDPGPEPPP